MTTNTEIVDKFFKFLAVIFSKDDMTELETKESLYFIQYIRSIMTRCLEAQRVNQIPILEMTVWATSDGNTNVSIDPTKSQQIRDSWFLSELIQRLMLAVNAWDAEDIGQKEGKVIDMMSKLGWVYTGRGRAG
jgi:hypothetical protein